MYTRFLVYILYVFCFKNEHKILNCKNNPLNSNYPNITDYKCQKRDQICLKNNLDFTFLLIGLMMQLFFSFNRLSLLIRRVIKRKEINNSWVLSFWTLLKTSSGYLVFWPFGNLFWGTLLSWLILRINYK